MIQKIFDCLSRRRLPLNNEKRTQEEIAVAFDEFGILYEREFRLDAKNVIDFKVENIGLECKIRGRKLEIFRQVERYAEFDAISSIILVTNVPTGFPPEVNGKPVYILNIAKAWL